MQLYLAKSKALSVSSAMTLTNLKTIINLGGAAKQTRQPILPVLKQKKTNYVCICSSAPITIEITRQTPTYVCSGNIDSIENSTSRNITRSVTINASRLQHGVGLRV